MASPLSHDAFASMFIRACRSPQCTTWSWSTVCSLPQCQSGKYPRRRVIPYHSHRSASTSSPPPNQKSKTLAKNQPPPPPTHSRVSQIPLPSGAKSETFTPKPLTHPLGLSYPPLPSQNTGLDPRSLRQRHADLTNYERHLVRRKELKSEFSKPYFRDWTMMKHAKGKSFVSNERLFRGERAGWFPNLWGHTLEKTGTGEGWLPKLGWNTTQILEGRVSVVTVFSGLWAERQVKSFVDQNQELLELIQKTKDSNGSPQMVRINVEDNWMRRMVVRFFMWRLRRQFKNEDWGRYFLVSKSLASDEIRDAMGFLNSRVGYVYLLDTHCRIRWAGSGDAQDGEITSLNNGLKRLLEETKREGEGEKSNVIVTEAEEVGRKATVAS